MTTGLPPSTVATPMTVFSALPCWASRRAAVCRLVREQVAEVEHPFDHGVGDAGTVVGDGDSDGGGVQVGSVVDFHS